MSMIAHLLRVSAAELAAYIKDPSLLEDRVYNEDSEDTPLEDIDKTWDGIIFLLTGQSIAGAEHHPLIRVLFSGQLIDEDQDLGYGPAHYLTAEQVKELSSQISGITTDDLKLKFDPQQMTLLEVYPNIWEEGDDAFDYIADGFSVLQEVYAEAARNGEAMITFIS